MYVSSLKYHIESIVFMHIPSDECVCPGSNAVALVINVLTETSRFDEKFYFSEKFLAIKLESIEREVKKMIESRKHYRFFVPLKSKVISPLKMCFMSTS